VERRDQQDVLAVLSLSTTDITSRLNRYDLKQFLRRNLIGERFVSEYEAIVAHIPPSACSL
jgi:hypothetical protein